MEPLQSASELDAWHGTKDPWGYETHPDDRVRREVLLAELPDRHYARVLDVGCGQGFITRVLPGDSVMGVDVSIEAVNHARTMANNRLRFAQASLFELPEKVGGTFDLIVITGVLYPQYIGKSLNLVYHIIDDMLEHGGVLASVHIDAWYGARFPYLMLKEHFYAYREYTHRFEVYVK